MQNLAQEGRTMVKVVKGLIKIAKAVAHVTASVDSKQPLQLMASRYVDGKIKMELISKPVSMDIENLKQKVIDYMKSPLHVKIDEVVPQPIVQDEKSELQPTL
jgi:hypothetical protein